MHVKDIKLLTDDHRIKHEISLLWDFALIDEISSRKEYIFRDELIAHDSFNSINQVLETVVSIYFAKQNIINSDRKLNNNIIRCLNEFSEYVYGDRHEWQKGTELEAERKKRKDILDAKRIIRQKYYEELTFLYPLLGISKLEKNRDLIVSISRIDELSEQIISHKAEINNDKKVLYNICEEYFLEKYARSEVSRQDIFIINMVSFFTYGRKDYWRTNNTYTDFDFDFDGKK